MAKIHTNKKSKHTLWIPDTLWHQIPDKNKTQYIIDAIHTAMQYPHNSHINQQPLIDELKNQIDELKRDKEYLKYMALPWYKRWKIPRLTAKQQK